MQCVGGFGQHVAHLAHDNHIHIYMPSYINLCIHYVLFGVNSSQVKEERQNCALVQSAGQRTGECLQHTHYFCSHHDYNVETLATWRKMYTNQTSLFWSLTEFEIGSQVWSTQWGLTSVLEEKTYPRWYNWSIPAASAIDGIWGKTWVQVETTNVQITIIIFKLLCDNQWIN